MPAAPSFCNGAHEHGHAVWQQISCFIPSSAVARAYGIMFGGDRFRETPAFARLLQRRIRGRYVRQTRDEILLDGGERSAIMLDRFSQGDAGWHSSTQNDDA